MTSIWLNYYGEIARNASNKTTSITFICTFGADDIRLLLFYCSSLCLPNLAQHLKKNTKIVAVSEAFNQESTRYIKAIQIHFCFVLHSTHCQLSIPNEYIK